MNGRLVDTMERLLKRAKERRDLIAAMLLEQRIAREADGTFITLVSR